MEHLTIECMMDDRGEHPIVIAARTSDGVSLVSARMMDNGKWKLTGTVGLFSISRIYDRAEAAIEAHTRIVDAINDFMEKEDIVTKLNNQLTKAKEKKKRSWDRLNDRLRMM